jgi:hypothetical protein
MLPVILVIARPPEHLPANLGCLVIFTPFKFHEQLEKLTELRKALNLYYSLF